MVDNKSDMSKLSFLGLLVLAWLVSYVPFANVALGWVETYFHEISHGLMALVTGGSIVRIELNPDGSGVCYTLGGWRLPVSFAGYAGAVLWGALLYVQVGVSNRRVAQTLVAALAVLVFVSGVIWARDLMTVVILAVILGLIFAAYAAGRYRLMQWAIRFVGVFVMLNAARTPLFLIDGQSVGDGQTLAGITYVPEIVWVAVWEAIAIYALWFVYRSHAPKPAFSRLAHRA